MSFPAALAGVSAPVRASPRRAAPRRASARARALGSNPEPMGHNAVLPDDPSDLPAMRQMCLKVATDAAKLGATIMLEKLGADVVKTKANARDLLTEVDPEVQAVIEARVRDVFPDHGFLGEESVAGGAAASERALETIVNETDWLWVVDPIDGTTNFCHSMPLSAISIGVAFRGELQAAVIMDPFAGEIFSASKGGGAYVNFKQIAVGEETRAETSRAGS